MTNEELAAAIQQGEKNLKPTLWSQVERFCRLQAYRVSLQLPPTSGATIEDLRQQTYLAFEDALERFEPGRGTFLTVLDYAIKTQFAELCGYRSARRDPLVSGNFLSLDAPLGGSDGDDDADITGEDVLVDPMAEAAYGAVEDDVYREQLHTAIDASLDALKPKQTAVMRDIYLRGRTQREVAETLSVSPQRVSAIERESIRSLRSGTAGRPLRQFLGDEINCYAGTGLATFRRTGTSSVEAAVLRLENLLSS